MAQRVWAEEHRKGAQSPIENDEDIMKFVRLGETDV